MKTFENWEKTVEHFEAHEFTHCGNSTQIHNYKTPNNIIISERTEIPWNFLKSIYTWQIVDYILCDNEAERNKVKAFNGTFSKDFYTDNEHGIATFENMEDAYNFAMSL